jgi:hypothetical protein
MNVQPAALTSRIVLRLTIMNISGRPSLHGFRQTRSGYPIHRPANWDLRRPQDSHCLRRTSCLKRRVVDVAPPATSNHLAQTVLVLCRTDHQGE